MKYEFELPLPPTTNHFHMPVRMGKHTRLITSPKVKQYQKQVRMALEELSLADLMISKPVEICLTIHHKQNRRYDVSNYLKAYEDALEKCGFVEDDSQIFYGYIRKGEKIKEGKIHIIAEVQK